MYQLCASTLSLAVFTFCCADGDDTSKNTDHKIGMKVRCTVLYLTRVSGKKRSVLMFSACLEDISYLKFRASS